PLSNSCSSPPDSAEWALPPRAPTLFSVRNDEPSIAELQCRVPDPLAPQRHAAMPPTSLSFPPALPPVPPDAWLPVRRAGRLTTVPPPSRTPSGSSCTCRTAPRRCADQ